MFKSHYCFLTVNNCVLIKFFLQICGEKKSNFMRTSDIANSFRSNPYPTKLI